MNKQLLLLGAFGAITSSASAAIVIQETFDYLDQTVLSSLQTGGTGFSGGYYQDSGLSTSPSTTTVRTTTFNLGTLNVGVPINNMGTLGGGDAHRALSATIDTQPTSATSYFISFTYNSDGAQGGARWGFGRSTNPTFEFRQVGGMQMTAYYSKSGGSTLGDNLSTTETFGNESLFVVAKLDLSNGLSQDRISFTVYQANDTIVNDGNFEYSVSGFDFQAGTPFNQIYFDAGGSNTRFGNMRVGESFVDVTGVPEPSTYALLFGLVALVGIVSRRKRV